MTAKEILDLIQAHRKEPTRESYAAMANSVKALVDERDAAILDAKKSERRANAFGDIISDLLIANQSALIDARMKSPEAGMAWIFNTLSGPGLLPDFDEAKDIGGAQAWFDEKTKAESIRVAAIESRAK